MDFTSTEYINSTDYKVLEMKLKDLKAAHEELEVRQRAARKLRYSEIDLEAERKAGRILPDELLIPRHLIDNNIKREQPSYIQYLTDSPRAVVCEDETDLAADLSLLEKDLTKKIRYDGWQLPMFSNVDCFQANGYGTMELVQDETSDGELAVDDIEFSDFVFLADTRDVQQIELGGRWMYFTKTRLKNLIDAPKSEWNREQVDKVLKSEPTNNISIEEYELKDKSLHSIMKTYLRVQGIVHVAWSCPDICDDWLRKPKPLFLGRRRITEPKAPVNNGILGTKPVPQTLDQGIPIQQSSIQPTEEQQIFQSYQQFQAQSMGKGDINQWALSLVAQGKTPPSEKVYETEFPIQEFPYLISENKTLTNLKGRVFLDQDIQEAVTSLISSTCTQARRASGLYGSRDVSDPNDDALEQKNFTLRSSCILNSKVNFTQLMAPDPGMFSAIQMLEAANQNETSNVNFAVQNRKDSRKTKKELDLAEQQTQQLTTVQVVLFSLSLKKLYTKQCAIIQSRVIAGLIKVDPQVLPLYGRKFKVKPSGDVDVIEKQKMVETMMNAWPVIQNTGASSLFLIDLLEKMFPENAAKYVNAIKQQQAQQQSQQTQQIQQLFMFIKQMAGGIIKLGEHPEMFSDTGRIHALPIVEHFSDIIKQVETQMKGNQNAKIAA